MAPNRSLIRNVFFHDATNPDVTLGGLFQNGSITEANSIFLTLINVPLETGVYDIYSDVPIELSREVSVEHATTHNITGRDARFRREVRNRNKKCVVSGIVNPEANIQVDKWSSFEACHIFPLQHESLWDELKMGRYVTDIEDTPVRAKINSSQNGLLLLSTIHTQFDEYSISVNPDDNYKIVVFGIDIFRVDGRILDPVCRSLDNPHHVPARLLRWHFEQSILASVRGA
ncbi:HNH endonuclease-domain-containing protein [Tuber indicum]|nr:HNH endonuclease-domain-containing protein [Tuber indicum]